MDDRTRCVADLDVSLEGYDSLTVPIHRASTIRYRDAESFTRRFERDADGYVYGLYGTPTHRHLEARLTDLHGGARTVLAPSGQAAITIPMLALVATGDRVLLPDAVYGPVRAFATTEAAALGVTCEFYDPCDLEALAALLAGGPTRLVWVESPGSVTMEVQDLPAIVAMAHEAGALVGCDNTWASPLYCRPLEHGADLAIEAISKHLGGHSDLLLGSVTTRDDALGLRLKAAFGRLGIGTSPDDCALAMRGIDTLGLRLASAGRAGLALARWLSEHPLVDRVLHPALESDPGHALWRRDFHGAPGVFSFTLAAEAEPHLLAALDALETIAIGASWGGTHSLVAPQNVAELRSVRPWEGPDHLLRLSVGVEAEEDLRADLARYLDAVARRLDAGGAERAAP